MFDLTQQLWAESEENRCPYVSYNGKFCHCNAIDSNIVCDTASLQLWCLDPKRYKLCHFYPQENFGKLFEASGPLRYTIDKSGYKLNVMVDQGVVDFYYSLVPKYVYLKRQAFAAHISVVRKEIPLRLELWGKYEGEEVKFTYSNIIHHGKVYYWLNAFSERLEEIRTELGLSISTEYTRPPDTFSRIFHITLGNTK